MSHSVVISWPGGEHRFALPLGRLRALQGTTNAGPEEIFNRFRTGTWRADDVLETLRQGLIGGGMEQEEAGPLIARIGEQHGLIDLKLAAYKVIGAALFNPDDDRVGKDEGAGTAPPENGGSAGSTDTGP